MKTTFLKLIVFVLIVGTFSNCNQYKLTNQDAKALIMQSLNLPLHSSKKLRIDYGAFYKGSFNTKLEEEGFITKKEEYGGCNIYLTKKGKPYLLEACRDHTWGFSFPKIKTYDIDFNEIIGISINKEQQTATIRFSLKAINITPLGALEKNIGVVRNGELVFKKFDTGWQLANDQNKSGIKLVEEIWWQFGSDDEDELVK